MKIFYKNCREQKGKKILENNRGAIGEGIIMIYRLVIISFIAFIILGLSTVFYAHYIDVRDAEAVILTRNVADCLTLANFNLGVSGDILNYCGFNDDRFFTRVSFFDSSGNKIKELTGGDSGSEWVKEIFQNKTKTKSIKQYIPGYFSGSYLFYDSVKKNKLNMEIEVIVKNE
jgi:hypothetical protein